MTQEQFYAASQIVFDLKYLPKMNASVTLLCHLDSHSDKDMVESLRKELQEMVDLKVTQFREAKIKELEEQLARI